jgi:ubiquinol-cytochrome c reductase cytochrome b subunit
VNWTEYLREHIGFLFSMDTWLPTELPEYAFGLLYTLGSLTASSFVILVVSGVLMAANGPQWWAVSPVGFFMRGVHFWSVQAFFFFMILHLLRVYFSGAWRGGRERTWLLGTLSLLVAIPTAFTGYLMRGDFYSEWNAVQAKDGLNAMGLAWFNVLNAGQMYGMHVVVFPLILGVLIALHITLIRVKGVVPPYPARDELGEDGPPPDRTPGEEVAGRA